MKVTITICEAAKKDQGGTLSALALGVSKLHVPAFPARFHGAVVMIAEPERTGEFPFTLDLKSPQDSDWTSIGSGHLNIREARDQVVAFLAFGLGLPVAGIYAFRINVDGAAAAHAHFTAVLGPMETS